ncbi:hypothetical protein LOK49_LG10G00939 [Camellia lanceoleosa]|uniref:Uncharacterized protein n=1 Tax=Camellia lanceoleosa TaxID=1840588 RepID=A0ACC0G5L4_9ERIC|nr:hypothetical protein LOK49_LG10G00939 [Camellia lanceoleosa]
MFVYDVNNNTWETLPDKDEGLAFIRRSYNNLLGVGNSLYWTRLGIIHVCNMKTWRYYVTEIEGIGNQICKAYDPKPERLLHFNGKEFCLLTLDEIEGQRMERTKIRCCKFKVSKQGTKKDLGSFMASLVCHDSYIVDWPLDFHSDHGLVLLEKSKDWINIHLSYLKSSPKLTLKASTLPMMSLRTLSSLELPRTVAVATAPSSPISNDGPPSYENQERTEVDSKSDVFGANERRNHDQTPHPCPSIVASNDVEEVPNEIPIASDPLEVLSLVRGALDRVALRVRILVMMATS